MPTPVDSHTFRNLPQSEKDQVIGLINNVSAGVYSVGVAECLAKFWLGYMHSKESREGGDYYPEQTAKLREILEAQIRLIVEKDNDYRGSWKEDGGIGAWFTMKRPMDRLRNMLKNKWGFDIFKAMVEEDAAGKTGQDGSIVACLHDLRSYALLCEAWLLLQKNPMNQPPLSTGNAVVEVNVPTPPDDEYATPSGNFLRGQAADHGDKAAQALLKENAEALGVPFAAYSSWVEVQQANAQKLREKGKLP